MTEKRVTIIDVQCFVCGGDLNQFKKSLLDTTSLSDKQIFKYLETFIGETFDDYVLESEVEVCCKCVMRFEQYDKFCLEAAKIQEEVAETFKNNQAVMSASIESLKCETCQEQYLNYDELKSHECISEDMSEEQYENVDYIVSELDIVEETKESIKESEIFNYTCNKCNERFQKKRNYKDHLRLSHPPENGECFVCVFCKDSEQFSSEMEYRLHVAIAHSTDPLFKCPICSRDFATKSLLNRHFGIHSSDSDRPHVCDICAKSFFHYTSFRAHMKIHADIRDFDCQECSKSFRSQSHLNRHIKVHTKQKNHECPDCGIRFAERYNLTAHKKTHLGLPRRK